MQLVRQLFGIGLIPAGSLCFSTRALPTETKVESGTSQGKSGPSLYSNNQGFLVCSWCGSYTGKILHFFPSSVGSGYPIPVFFRSVYSSPIGCTSYIVKSFRTVFFSSRALSGRLKCTVRRHNFDEDVSLYNWARNLLSLSGIITCLAPVCSWCGSCTGSAYRSCGRASSL